MSQLTLSISQTELCSLINKACKTENPDHPFRTSPDIGVPFSSCSSSPSLAIFNFPSLNVLTLLIPSSLFPYITLPSLYHIRRRGNKVHQVVLISLLACLLYPFIMSLSLQYLHPSYDKIIHVTLLVSLLL